MDRLFLDANILFAAAYRARAGLRRLWQMPDVELVSSSYACGEAHRNLMDSEPQKGVRPTEREQIDKLDRLVYLMRSVRVVDAPADSVRPEGIDLPEKDWPILVAAIAAQASHLLTADVQHFGPYFGRSVGGVLILPPAEYLRQWDAT